MKRTAGLREEILLTLILLFCAALLLVGLLMLRFSGQILLKEKISHLSSLASVLTATMPQREGFPGGLNINGLKRLSDTSLCEGWWVFDRNLQLLSSFIVDETRTFPEVWKQQVKMSRETQFLVHFPSLLRLFGRDKGYVSLAVPILQSDGFLGVLIASFSLEDITISLLQSLKGVLLYALTFGIVLMFIGYYLFQRNVIRPAMNLLNATEAVKQGNLTQRLPVSGPKEMLQLASAYNDMVVALEKSRNETNEHINSLKSVNLELQETRSQLLRSEKLSSLGQLAAGLAHEVGNPLSSIIGYLELLKSGLSREEGINVAKRSLLEANRIDLLVREVLEFSRPAEKNNFEKLNPASEIDFCLTLLKNQGHLQKMTLHIFIPNEITLAVMSKSHFQQVFMNLLLNAIAACRPSGTITISGKKEGEFVLISIEDTGCGIATENLNKIFDPFFTTKQPGEGVGLGLTLCHRIIEDAGGYFKVDSKVGSGSKFSVFLPLTL